MGGIELEEKRYCKNCGRELEENAKFCGKCGQKVEPVRQEEKKVSNGKHCRRKKIKGKMAAGVGIAVFVVASVAIVTIGGIQKRKFEKNSEEIMTEKEAGKKVDKKEKKNPEQDKYMALVQNEDGKWGAINSEGKMVIPCELEDSDFLEKEEALKSGLCCAEKNGKYGYIDREGKEVIPFIYENADQFSENGLAPVEKDGKWGYINKEGKEEIPFIYDNAQCFSWNGLAVVESEGKEGCINENGDVKISFRYSMVQSFSQKATVTAVLEKDDTGEWKNGIVNEQGEEILPCIFDFVYTYPQSEIILVQSDEKYGCFEQSGRQILPCAYDSLWIGAGEQSRVIIAEKDEKYGCFSTDGKEIVPCVYDFVNASDNYILVCQGEEIYWLDENGKQVSEVPGDEVIIPAEKDGKWGYVNGEGQVIVPFEYDSMMGELGQTDVAAVEKEGKWGYINKEGEEVIPAVYEALDYANMQEPGELMQIGNAWISNPLYVPMFPEEGVVVYLNKEGEKMKMDQEYDFGREFGENGFAAVGIEQEDSTEAERKYIWNYIDESGKVMLELSEDIVYVGDFFKVE